MLAIGGAARRGGACSVTSPSSAWRAPLAVNSKLRLACLLGLAEASGSGFGFSFPFLLSGRREHPGGAGRTGPVSECCKLRGEDGALHHHFPEEAAQAEGAPRLSEAPSQAAEASAALGEVRRFTGESLWGWRRAWGS